MLIYFCLPTALASIIAWVSAYRQMLLLIRDRHPELYAQLGSPSLSLCKLSWDGKLLDFIFKREHASLGDSRLSRHADIALLAFVGFMLSVVFTALQL